MQPTTVSTGTQLTVTGTGFSVTPHVQLVSTGNATVVVQCIVSSYTSNSIQCVVGSGNSGSYTLSVVVGTVVLALACTHWGIEGCPCWRKCKCFSTLLFVTC